MKLLNGFSNFIIVSHNGWIFVIQITLWEKHLDHITQIRFKKDKVTARFTTMFPDQREYHGENNKMPWKVTDSRLNQLWKGTTLLYIYNNLLLISHQMVSEQRLAVKFNVIHI